MLIQRLKTVACGISGGVDSAVSAHLLKKCGYNVIGVFMKNWDLTDENGFCNSDKELEDADYACKKIGIGLYEANFVKEYWNDVFSELIKEYQDGFTPNPDILCNKNIKFKSFHHHCIEKYNADYIATGHYARISENVGHGVKLLKAKDEIKDQTFFLSQISQEALQKTLFPLGSYVKSNVKRIANEIGLEYLAKKKESTGICFIGKRNFQDFINDYVSPKPGNFVDIETGQVVGQHKGVHCWTIGQRCHIGGKPVAYYVAKKNTENQDIYVAPGHDHGSLFHDSIETNKPHFIHSVPKELQGPNGILNCEFRFQHGEKLVNCALIKRGVNWFVHFENHIRALTPGQYAVFYSNEECLGSGRILKTGLSLYETTTSVANRFESSNSFINMA